METWCRSHMREVMDRDSSRLRVWNTGWARKIGKGMSIQSNGYRE
ncbi:MAG: hypothetical protein ACKO9Z_15495 [Planctomycetota bacterium]